MLRLKRIKAVAVALATMAGLAVAVTPAQAADTCTAGGGGKYVCDYGVTDHKLPNGEKEQFLVGLDYAVWTRWTVSKQWTGWVSMGMPDPLGNARATSKISVSDAQGQGKFETHIVLKNSNGAIVGKTRPDLGANWWTWDWPKCC
ncbi:hypothetical protein GO001_25475 [Streptomyces sp. NRRL B-1677]|uniref:Uncharacterized protein n=1 Tax=Streptomyces klenkii TaxID=1420899 RepID=A0A3B0C2R2_9ACTN|nr:hypothetical protein [Streptomyces sp. NRRL B-1677]RKN77596.1 hypothetical protein D7231_02515 [Streptomyces klenkii]